MKKKDAPERKRWIKPSFNFLGTQRVPKRKPGEQPALSDAAVDEVAKMALRLRLQGHDAPSTWARVAALTGARQRTIIRRYAELRAEISTSLSDLIKAFEQDRADVKQVGQAMTQS